METYQEEPNQPTHGYNGPLKVSYGGQFMQISKDFLDVAAEYDKERKATTDMNALYECDGYGVRLYFLVAVHSCLFVANVRPSWLICGLPLIALGEVDRQGNGQAL